MRRSPAAVGLRHRALERDERTRTQARLGGDGPLRQVLVEEPRALERVGRGPEPPQDEIAQARAHGIADHERAPEHGHCGGHAEERGEMRAPIVDEAAEDQG